MKKILIILSVMMSLCMLGMVEVGAQTYYVDASSKESSGDGSVEKPFKTVQDAVDIVKAGDEVIVMPGIYYESVTVKKSGTADKPIIIRAADPGENKTIITCANKSIREKETKWICEDPSINLYYVPYDRNVGSVLYNGAKMFAYKSLEELKTFRAWFGTTENHSSTMDGFYHGYYYDPTAKRLYVRIGNGDKYGDTDPNKNLMAVGGPYYNSVIRNGKEESAYRRSGISIDSYCMGVVTENSANVIISGFTFEVPGWAGVFCRANDVTIDNCWFKGCFSGIAGGRYSAYDQWISENVTMQSCDWNLWPTFDDGVEAQQRKSSTYPWRWWCTKTLDWGVFDYEAGGVLTQVGKNWTLKDSNISQCLDGLSSGCLDGYYVYLEKYGTNINVGNADGLIIDGCHFYDILDNALEVENHAKNVEMFDCEVGNCLEHISWQPLGGEPWPTNILIHNNIFKSDEWFINLVYETANTPAHWLKFGAAASNWDKPSMKMKGDKIVDGVPLFPIVPKEKGVWIYNNSVYLPNGYSSQITGNMVGSGQESNNMHVVNNIVYCRAQPDSRPFRTYIPVGDYIGGDQAGWWSHRNNLFVQSNPQEVEAKTEPMGGKGFNSFEGAGIEWSGRLFYLKENSIGRGMGEQVLFEERDTTDVGAVPYGEEWEIHAGPYALGDANRDGSVDLLDVMAISKAIGTTKDNDMFDSYLDGNFDGIIDSKDLQLVIKGMSKIF